MPTVTVTTAEFDPWQLMAATDVPTSGACASFVGYMRDFNNGQTVSSMTLEHYPGMTEHQLQRIAQQAESRWGLNGVLIHHRVGLIVPEQPIVLVACWADHRSAAFEAVVTVMERLKHEAPFWKLEKSAQGEKSWVESNSTGPDFSIIGTK